MLTIPVIVYRRDVREPEHAKWGLGFWDRVGDKVWGLTFHELPTHMCYGFSYADPRKAIKRRRESFKEDPVIDWLRYYFDVGARLYMTLDDLEEAIELLESLDETSKTV